MVRLHEVGSFAEVEQEVDVEMEAGCPADLVWPTDWHDALTTKPTPGGSSLDSGRVLFYAFGTGMDSQSPPQAALWSFGTAGCSTVAGAGCIDFWWAKEACPEKTTGKEGAGCSGGNIPGDGSSFPFIDVRSKMLE